jgi:hypothetical protein
MYLVWGVIFYLHANQIFLMAKKRQQPSKCCMIVQLSKPFLLLFIRQGGSGIIPMRDIF